MPRNRFLAVLCNNPQILVIGLSMCVAFLVLSLFSFALLDRNSSAFVVTQLNLVILSILTPTLLSVLYLCRR